jgi:hypothetical protein
MDLKLQLPRLIGYNAIHVFIAFAIGGLLVSLQLSHERSFLQEI